MSNHLLFKRIMSVMLVLALAFSIFPMAVYAEENTATVSFSIDGTSYKVDMKFEDDLLYCRADQWAEAAGCLWMFNSDQQKVFLYYDTPVILASYDNQTYIADASNMWVPFFDAAAQTGVYFSEVSGFTVCGYRAKPLAVFYKDMDRMFAVSKYRTTEMIIELGGVWALISSASRSYAILSSLSLKGFVDAVSGKMDQDMYDAVLLDMLKTDETLLGAITGAGEALERPGKIINLLQKSLDEDGALVELLEEMDFSESEIQEIVWDLSQEAYGNKTLNDLSDFYEANKATHFFEMLEFIDDMTVSLEADIHTAMAVQAVFANSDSAQMRHAAEKAIGARVGNKALTAGMYSLEFLGEIFLDNAIGKLEEAYEKSAGITSLKKLGAEAFVWVLDKSLSMAETTNVIMYSDVYSQIQLELTNYYYRHRNDSTSDNGLMMHSVALLYLRSCLAAWQMFEYDESLAQPISNATSTLTAEITNLMQYTEDELLQNGTSEDSAQAIIDLVIRCQETAKQESQYESNTEVFIDEILSEYGQASSTEFVSCIGTWFQEYPSSIDGFITAVSVDLNTDGKDEQVALISKEQTIYLQVYSESSGEYVLSCEEDIASIDYCAQQNISLFYNEEMNGYLLFVDKNTGGAYTGNDAKYATIYEVNCTNINLVCQASADYFGIETDDIDGQLAAYAVPYAQNCSEIDSITSQSRYIELLEIRHKFFNADPLGGWPGREHHLQLLTPAVRNKPVDAVQTWTITMQSYQGFTEYREETWTQEFETGKQYTLLPMWEDGEETGYRVLSYSVDTQERTIVIFMDHPEGLSYWKGLVLDLENNTYYGLEYTEP